MKLETFQRYETELVEAATAILAQRNVAYAENDDYLANFRRISRATGLTPAKVCEVYMQKALTAMSKLLNGQDVPGETMTERFADMFNYVKLAYAICREDNSPAPSLWEERHPLRRVRDVM